MLSREKSIERMALAIDKILSNHVSTTGLCIDSKNIAEAALVAILECVIIKEKANG